MAGARHRTALTGLAGSESRCVATLLDRHNGRNQVSAWTGIDVGIDLIGAEYILSRPIPGTASAVARAVMRLGVGPIRISRYVLPGWVFRRRR
jgi:hypothetical protein